MGILLFVTFIVVVIVIASILQHNQNKRKGNVPTPVANDYLKERYQELLKDLRHDDEQYHEMRKLWIAFQSKYESLGEPTIRIGYQKEERMPWQFPTITIPYDEIAAEPDPGKRIDMVNNAAHQLRMYYAIPSIGKCATLWKEARIAVLGREELTPDQVRFVKSNRNNPLKWIEVIVTTNQIERPTVSVFFEPDERNEADDLKAAVNAFKTLK